MESLNYLGEISIDYHVAAHRVLGKESEGVTRQQAEDFVAQARTDSRVDRLNLPKGRKTLMSFAEAARLYPVRLGEECGRDIGRKVRRIEMHLIPFFGPQALAAITTSDVERYKQTRLNAGASPGTVNCEQRVLSHLLSKAVQWEWIERKRTIFKRLAEGSGRITYLC